MKNAHCEHADEVRSDVLSRRALNFNHEFPEPDVGSRATNVTLSGVQLGGSQKTRRVLPRVVCSPRCMMHTSIWHDVRALVSCQTSGVA